MNVKQVYTQAQYKDYVEKISPKASFTRNMIMAFVVGGLVCDFGQLLLNYFKGLGFDNDTSGTFMLIILIFIGAFLTGIGVFDDIGKYAGAGSAVPITGFANSIVSPAMEFKSEGFILGVGAKMFVIAGPVLVYGLLISTVIATIYYLLGL